ncbi:MAG: hypothetical protein EA397_07835 [Deltaproteobacteria bacterium]|nr:MAG: hypothetical protein EA397_07835 [Deltaproteobacteria bacterium]
MSEPLDPVDQMIYQRATRALWLNGLAPVVVASVSIFFNPCGTFTVFTYIAAVSTFTVPVVMRRRLDDDRLFPTWAANGGRVLGGLACALTSAIWGGRTFSSTWRFVEDFSWLN